MAEVLFGVGVSSHRRRQRRMLGLLAVWGLVLLLGAVAFCYHLLAGSFADAESQAVSQRAEQVLRAFEADLQQLAMAAHGYAEGDDAGRLLADGDVASVGAYFVPGTLEALHVDLVWIRDHDGNTVYSAWYDPATGVVRAPAGAELLQAAAAAAATYSARTPRVAATPAGPMALAAHEIRSDRGGTSGGVLIFGRLVDIRVLQRVRTTTQLPAALRVLPADGAKLSPEVSSWLRDRGSDSTFVQVGDEHSIRGYAQVRAADGTPLLVFSVPQPRTIYALGVETARLLLGCVVLLFVLFGGTLLYLLAHLQRARRTSERRYRDVAAHLGELILLVEPGTLRIVEANQAVVRLLGYSPEELGALDVRQIFSEVDVAALEHAAAAGPEGGIVGTRTRRKDGAQGDMELSITQLADSAQNLLVVVGRDVSHRRAALEEQQENQRKLIHLAQHDSLTGLPNRLYLRTRLPALLQKLAEREQGLVLIYVDVDQFKNFNDSRGHAFGDRMLQIVARRLRSVVSEHDSVVRMGGDEFVIVLTMETRHEAVEAVIARLREALSEPLHIEGTALVVTASMGIALHPQDGLDMDVLLKHADIALYLAKDAGRNCHRYFKANMEVRVSEDMALEQAMRHALGTDQFELEYQPVVDLATNRVCSLEALLRWRHPDMGSIPPARFIPVAERSGMIVALGEQALQAVLAQLHAWQAAKVTCVPVAVNVSALQLERDGFADMVQRRAAEAGVDPRWLHFEITESALLREQEQIVQELTQLRELGSEVLIDDFGTGYSALSYLHRLPVGGLKIDRSFVTEMVRNGGQSAIIGAIVKIARELRLHVIVEGVETAEQLMMLREYRCAAAQGYFFSKPIPATRCTRLLQNLDDVQRAGESTTVRILRASELSLAG